MGKRQERFERCKQDIIPLFSNLISYLNSYKEKRNLNFLLGPRQW
jgi:hypothetical protein